MSIDIKQRLQQAIDDAHGIPPLEPDTLQLCRDAQAEIERLELIVRRCNTGARRVLVVGNLPESTYTEALQAIIEITNVTENASNR